MDAELKKRMLAFANETEVLTRRLGITVLDIDDVSHTSTVVMDIQPEGLNHWDAPHGGALFTLCDEACGTAATTVRAESLVTVSAAIDFLAAASPEGRLTATGHVDKAGGRLVFCSAQVRDEADTLIARFHSVWSFTGQPLPL